MKEMNDRITTSAVVIFAVLLLLAVLSVAVPGRRFAEPESYSSSVQALNETKSGVEKLAGSAAAASAAITLMPGDFGTPIADKLADLSGYFLLILCAVYIEKFLVSMAGILAFDVLVPVGLVILALGVIIKKPLTAVAVRMISLGLILFLLVPVSLKVSDLIKNQYAEEIQQTIDDANQNTDELRGTADRSDDDSIWSEFTARIKGGSATLLNKLETLLSSFIDAIAVYIVTTCVIPVLILLLGFWIIKLLFRLDIKLPRFLHMSDYTTRRYRASEED